MRFYLVLFLSISVILNSCKKDKDSDPATNDIAHDIYIGGSDDGPVYWKNNIRVSLPDSTTGSGASYVSRIFVNGNDVYAVGACKGQATYWKNGTLEILPGIYPAQANGIAIINGDVYVSGMDNYSTSGLGTNAVYWKNGVKYSLISTSGTSYAKNIFVDGNDIYFVGWDYLFGAVYWKNDTLFPLSIQSSTAYDMKIYNSEIYVAGDSINYAAYWKNGILNVLPNTAQYAFVTSIFINAGDLLLCGKEVDNPVMWTNGQKGILPIDSNTQKGHASEITKLGIDVYVAGFEMDNASATVSHALFWKNGIRNVLPSISNSTFANCIFIK